MQHYRLPKLTSEIKAQTRGFLGKTTPKMATNRGRCLIHDVCKNFILVDD